MARSRSVHLPEKRSTIKWVAGFVVLGVVVISGAMYLGKSDKGAIDVSATIANSNATRDTSGNSTTQEVPTVPAEFANKVNGGLVPASGNNSAPAPTPASTTEVATGTATTTATDSTTANTTN